MAEAAVEERTPPKFYCHMCNVQFHNASAVSMNFSAFRSDIYFFLIVLRTLLAHIVRRDL